MARPDGKLTKADRASGLVKMKDVLARAKHQGTFEQMAREMHAYEGGVIAAFENAEEAKKQQGMPLSSSSSNCSSNSSSNSSHLQPLPSLPLHGGASPGVLSPVLAGRCAATTIAAHVRRRLVTLVSARSAADAEDAREAKHTPVQRSGGPT